jgi:CDP-diacylglycerol---glycerol-3-phosphate 3-phosphatidyltransferase
VGPGVTASSLPVSRLNLANLLTAVRIAMVPVFAWLLLRDDGRSDQARWAAALVFTLAVATDRLDGEVARRWKLVTDLGKLADPIADKVLIGAALIGLSQLGEVPWWMTVVILGREVAVTVVRLAVLRHGVIPAGRGGKAKTAVQALAILLLVAPLDDPGHPVARLILAVAVLLTVTTGVDYVVQALRLRTLAVAGPVPGAGDQLTADQVTGGPVAGASATEGQPTGGQLADPAAEPRP